MNIKKLLSKGRLVPIYKATGDEILLMGYQRKANSRKRSQRPFLLPQPLVLAKVAPNPESK